MAKAFTAQRSRIPIAKRRGEWRYFWLFIPMVIISGDMFYVDSMEANSAPQEIDYVTFKREIRSGTLDDIFTVEFVRQNQLEAFIFDRLGPLITKMTDLTTNHADFVLRRSIPWKD